MQEDNNNIYPDQQSWLDCIGQLISKNNNPLEGQIQQTQDPIFLQTSNFPIKIISNQQDQPLQTQAYQYNQNQDCSTLKRSRQDTTLSEQNTNIQIMVNQLQEHQQDVDSFKQQSKQDQKLSKWGKQSLYSKNYRQKKKEQMKILQEQNHYLKEKINDLQRRLRQKQIQLNRLKQPPSQKQYSVQQLNEQFLKKTNLILQKSATEPAHYSSQVCIPEHKLYNQFMKSYDEHGFGGTRKKNILNYYFNEMLQTIMRDSEKYLFLICNNKKNYQQITGIQSYQQIDLVFQQVMEINQQKKERIKYFTKNLHRYMHQIKGICCQLYVNFNKIIGFVDKVHTFMKSSYPDNMDFARKRIQLQNWFQHNKHSKLIRRLRSQWVQNIKESAQKKYKQQQEKYNLKSKNKRKNTLVKKPLL